MALAESGTRRQVFCLLSPGSGDCPRIGRWTRMCTGAILTWREPGRSAEACGVVKADSKTDAEWPQVLGTVPAMAVDVALTSGPLCRVGCGHWRKTRGGSLGWHQKMREREERTNPEGQGHGRGREKRKPQEEAEMTRLPNREEKRDRESRLFLPKFSPPSCSFPWFSSFLPLPAPPLPKPHFYSEESSHLLSDKWHSFLGSEEVET